MIEIRQLRHMLALAEHSNFKRASKALGISQPALTKSIQRLEAELKVQLFDRGVKSVTPTEFGQAVIERARKVTLEYDAIPGEIDLLTGMHRGELVVGTGPSTAEMVVARAVVRLTAVHPHLRVVIKIADARSLAESLHTGEISLFVADRTETGTDKHLQVTPLLSVPGVWFARGGHPLAGRAGLTLNELIDYPIIGPMLPERIVRQFEDQRDRLDRPERLHPSLLTIECDDFALIRAMVRQSLGLSSCPYALIEEEVERGSLVPLDVVHPLLRTVTGVITLKDRTIPPAARALIDEMNTVARTLGPDRPNGF